MSFNGSGLFRNYTVYDCQAVLYSIPHATTNDSYTRSPTIAITTGFQRPRQKC